MVLWKGGQGGMGTTLKSYEPEFISHIIYQMKCEGCVCVPEYSFLCLFGVF